MLTIEDGRARVTIRPDMGAGLARFDALTADGPKPVLRPMEGASGHPFDLACNLMIPFANRISGGGFVFGDSFHPVAPNLPDQDPLPLHGDALGRRWRVEDRTANAVTLHLADGAIGPWRYDARMTWQLTEGTLHGELTVTNIGQPLPFGGGFHPWLPRLGRTELRFAAGHVWLSDDANLPTERIAVGSIPDWNFARSRPLPQTPIDNCFAGWDGKALVAQPDLGIDIAIAASQGFDHAMVFAPSADAGFFCFEPVSHAVDAINAPGHSGMTVLAFGDAMTVSMTIRWTPREG